MTLSAIVVSSFSLGVSLSISFLSIERVLIILRSNLHIQHHKYFAWFSFISCAAMAVTICSASLWIEWPLDEKTGKH